MNEPDTIIYCFSSVTEVTSLASRLPSHLECILLDDSLLNVLLQFMQDSQHGDVGLPGSSWCTNQKVLVAVVGRLKDHRLDAVQIARSLEGNLTNL